MSGFSITELRAKNEFARDHLYGWADGIVRRLRAQREQLVAENDHAMRVVRRADRQPVRYQSRSFDKATRAAFNTAGDISRIDEAITEIAQATFADLLPRFRQAHAGRRLEAA